MGGAYELEPNPLTIRLSCGTGETVLGLTPEDEAVMASFGQAYAGVKDEPPPAGGLIRRAAPLPALPGYDPGPAPRGSQQTK